ncbi:unnamed protein product [Arabidopsis thaliana]|uniref:Uncharacterized protein n=1 Tax=Arabidopsis thaliana TaxID=3702 RepID=A0A654ER61_ARATH|nr:unnamed protein product [Arabidopsis thaliana]
MSVMGTSHCDVNLAIHCQSSIDSGALPSEPLQEVLAEDQMRLVATLPHNWCFGRRIWVPGILCLPRFDKLAQEKMKTNGLNPLVSLVKGKSIVINRCRAFQKA